MTEKIVIFGLFCLLFWKRISGFCPPNKAVSGGHAAWVNAHNGIGCCNFCAVIQVGIGVRCGGNGAVSQPFLDFFLAGGYSQVVRYSQILTLGMYRALIFRPFIFPVSARNTDTGEHFRNCNFTICSPENSERFKFCPLYLPRKISRRKNHDICIPPDKMVRGPSGCRGPFL